MRRNNLVTEYPYCFGKIQTIALDLNKVIESLLLRSDEETTFHKEEVNTISNSVGVMLNYWDGFDNDYQKENITSLRREAVDQQVKLLRNDLDNLENETETFIQDYSKRQLFLMGEWILYIIDLLE